MISKINNAKLIKAYELLKEVNKEIKNGDLSDIIEDLYKFLDLEDEN